MNWQETRDIIKQSIEEHVALEPAFSQAHVRFFWADRFDRLFKAIAYATPNEIEMRKMELTETIAALQTTVTQIKEELQIKAREEKQKSIDKFTAIHSSRIKYLIKLIANFSHNIYKIFRRFFLTSQPHK